MSSRLKERRSCDSQGPTQSVGLRMYVQYFFADKSKRGNSMPNRPKKAKTGVIRTRVHFSLKRVILLIAVMFAMFKLRVGLHGSCCVQTVLKSTEGVRPCAVGSMDDRIMRQGIFSLSHSRLPLYSTQLLVTHHTVPQLLPDLSTVHLKPIVTTGKYAAGKIVLPLANLIRLYRIYWSRSDISHSFSKPLTDRTGQNKRYDHVFV